MLAMLAALDDSIHNVTEALKARGLYNNTIIVFASDNGGAVQGPPQTGAMNNHPLRGGKSA
jgi:arylsulfatase A-like enzyme